MNEQGNNWPEQERISQWERKHNLDLPHPATQELAEILTQIRLNYNGKLKRIREIVCLEEDI